MIGEKVVLRVRMSAKDAHYAGELVNGSKILDYFGDVATELSIRNDGDESLFRSYDSVDFLAPVYAGDFMEYHGWIESAGKTSRKMKFEAYKVIELARDTELALSAANVLEEPVLVGKASGTLIVPLDHQRGPQDPKFKA
jgi:3-aminobutyryl-CoA ammonia-lyase